MNKNQSLRLFTAIHITFAIACVIISALMAMEILDPFSSHYQSAIVAALAAYVICDYVRAVRKGWHDETE